MIGTNESTRPIARLRALLFGGAILLGAFGPVIAYADRWSAPSDQDVVDVLRHLPGNAKAWRFPGSIARSVSFQRPTMADPTATHTVALETTASVAAVQAFYEAAISKAGAERLEPPARPGCIVLQFRGGSILVGNDGEVTFIVIVVEDAPVAGGVPSSRRDMQSC